MAKGLPLVCADYTCKVLVRLRAIVQVSALLNQLKSVPYNELIFKQLIVEQ